MRLIDADDLGVGRCSKDVLPAAYCAGWNGLLGLIEKAPTVDVAPVAHGQWMFEHETENTLSMTKCNVCGWWTLDPSVDGVYKYCPNCGAKMDGDSDALD